VIAAKYAVIEFSIIPEKIPIVAFKKNPIDFSTTIN
jgi:hypothetical protein